MSVHVIRLRDPWQTSLDGQGRRCHERHFNRPTGIDAGERVLLVVDATLAALHAQLNEQPLGSIAAESQQSFDVTRLLLPHNRLQLQVVPCAGEADSAPSGEEPRFAVHLEIHAASPTL